MVRRTHIGRTSVLFSLGYVMLLTGCSPGVRSARFEDFAPKPSDHAIRLYSESRPECTFREIGMVRITKRTIFVSIDEVTAALREEARRMGGDAVIGVSLGGGERPGGSQVTTS